MNSMHRLAFALAVLVLAGAFGCSGGSPNTPSTLTGKVTYKDAPVTGGNITLYTEAGVYTLPIDAKGEYSGQDLPSGSATVTIETESLNRSKVAYGGSKDKKMFSPVPEGANPGAGGQYVKIPPKYADKTKSGLTITLTKGKQTHDFNLTD